MESRPDFFPSPAWAESSLCASLAVWEAVSLGDSRSCQWRLIWSEACSKLHHGREGLTLADLPGSEPSSWRRDFATPADIAKAYRRVRRGMHEVYKNTLAQFSLNGRLEPALRRAAAVTDELITAGLKADAAHGPAGQEAYLLRLIQWLECFLSRGHSDKYVWEAWREQVRHTRLYGPASSKTLATALPQEARLKRAKATQRLVEQRALGRLVRKMRPVIAALYDALSSLPAAADGVESLR